MNFGYNRSNFPHPTIMAQEFTFNWQWDIKSAPEAIWPLAADTNRFNRDTGQPEVELLSNVKGTKLARMKLPIIRVEWEEEPFEWTYPYSFGIVRRYRKGPLDEMRINARFDPLPEGGTRITYRSILVTAGGPSVPAPLTDHLLAVKAQGFRAFKMGWGPFGRVSNALDKAIVKAARDAVGSESRLMVDAGGSEQFWPHGLNWARETAKMLAESALCLAYDPLTSAGGCTTPAVAMPTTTCGS